MLQIKIDKVVVRSVNPKDQFCLLTERYFEATLQLCEDDLIEAMKGPIEIYGGEFDGQQCFIMKASSDREGNYKLILVPSYE